MRKELGDEIFGVIFIIIVGVGLTVFSYTQRYVENTYTNTAKKGIIWTRSIDLKQYKVIGDGSGLFGEYTLVTRSMTQGKDEATTIYKD